MTMLEVAPPDAGDAVRIPDDEVGIHPDLDRALAVVEPGESRRLEGQPSSQLRQLDLTLHRPRPCCGQAQLQRADPSPGLTEVPIVETLDLGRGRRVIGDDHVQAPVHETIP